MARRSRPNQRSAVLDTVKDEPPAAVAQGAILDGACARRSAFRRRLGRRNGQSRSNKGMGS